MCQDPSLKTASPDDAVLPFVRTTTAAAAGAVPPQRPNRAAALDGLSDCRAMLGLALLAAEALPSGHSIEFMAVLEVVHTRLAVALHALGAHGGA